MFLKALKVLEFQDIFSWCPGVPVALAHIMTHYHAKDVWDF